MHQDEESTTGMYREEIFSASTVLAAQDPVPIYISSCLRVCFSCQYFEFPDASPSMLNCKHATALSAAIQREAATDQEQLSYWSGACTLFMADPALLLPQ
jgi:hypothetical protein